MRQDRAGEPRLHLPRLAHRGHRRARASCRPTSAALVRDPAQRHDQADLRGLRDRDARAGGRGRPRSPTASSSGSAIVRLVERHAGSAELVPEVGDFIASLKAPLRALGGATVAAAMAWFWQPKDEAARTRRARRSDRRGPLDQVRVLQGDRLPRRGGQRRARLPACGYPFRISARERIAPSCSTPAPSRSATPGSARGTRSASRTPGATRDRAQVRPREDRLRGGRGLRRGPRSAGYPVVLCRLRVRVHGRQHGLGGGREAHARHRAGHAEADRRSLIVSRLGRRPHAGGHPLAHADGQDLGGARAARPRSACPTSRCSPIRPRAA